MFLVCMFIFLLFCFGRINANSNNPPIVATPLGTVQGQWKTSYDERRYAAFEGIPYAKPPIGSLRFEEPQPISPWPGIWNATQIYRCLQKTLDLKPDTGDEDCLYINVFVPTTDQSELDVVIHIHGGGFISGSGSDYLNEKYVMDRDIVFVTFNYRLGALGFLSTGDEIVPGNNGLKDQVLALKWVQQNIASFGGNPNSVTITGFSAGGVSVHLHYLSPLSKGLFHRGISLSGAVANDWLIKESVLEETKQLASVVGCPDSDSKELVECLKTRPASLLIENTKYLYGFGPSPICLFSPVIENSGKNPFLHKHPEKILLEKEVLDLPWITSVTRDEGIMISLMFLDKLQEMDEKWTEVAKYVLDFRNVHYARDAPTKIKDYYLGEGQTFNENNVEKFTKMTTDIIKINAESAAKLQSKVTTSPVYFYYFNYDKGENSFGDLFTTERLPGVSHGDDMVYFFGGPISKELSESDIKLKNACLDMLYSYAKYGVPSFKGIDWQPTKGDQLTYLNITSVDDIKLQITSDLTGTNKFWKEIGLLKEENLSAKTEL